MNRKNDNFPLFRDFVSFDWFVTLWITNTITQLQAGTLVPPKLIRSSCKIFSQQNQSRWPATAQKRVSLPPSLTNQMDPTLLSYISHHVLPPTNEPDHSLLLLLNHLQLPLEGSSLAFDSVEFWDQRVVSAWGEWDGTKWEKWIMDSTEVEVVKEVMRRLNAGKMKLKEEDERLDEGE